jgi:hypothetical protein
MLAKTLLFCITFIAQQPHTPDLDAQRAAMKKLEFLVGKWTGEARMLRAQAEPLVMIQTEEAQYKLGGLVLSIEGADGKPALQAFGIVSYDDETGTYRMRAFNDGRFLETEVKLIDKGFTWGFALGPYRTSSVMRIDDKGNWTEQHEISIGTQAPKKFMEMSLHKSAP